VQAALDATVLIPTTGDRWATLQHALASVREQTVTAHEVFVMGDGVEGATRDAVRALECEDPRVRFFDHPKHERRGEPHRHAALGEARGRIVAYLCDRDLMLPWHLETLGELLRDADLVNTLIFRVHPGGELRPQGTLDLGRNGHRRALARGFQAWTGIPLSMGGHTLAAYRRLPYGWRTTPAGRYTDYYMWQQLAAQPSCRSRSGLRPSILYFPKSPRQDWSAARKGEELAAWRRLMSQPDAYARLLEDLVARLQEDRVAIAERLRNRLGTRVYKGLPPALRRVPGVKTLLHR
jgi:hypothetical protein